jgi:hypothetical protein
LKLRSLVRRRPSPAMAISLVALFMSLGGVGYAATQLPANSVGTAQLRDGAVSYKKIQPNSVGKVRLADGGVINSKLSNGSVSYKKIQPAAVGRVRANLNQLQARVNGTCSAGSAIGAVDSKGATTCNSTRPAEFGAVNNPATPLTGTAAAVTSVNLPAGSTYLAFANPTATVTGSGTAQRVTVSCTLNVATTTVTRSATVNTGASTNDSSVSIPLQLAVPAGAATVSCLATPDAGTLPRTVVTSSINAIQTASNS